MSLFTEVLYLSQAKGNALITSSNPPPPRSSIVDLTHQKPKSSSFETLPPARDMSYAQNADLKSYESKIPLNPKR